MYVWIYKFSFFDDCCCDYVYNFWISGSLDNSAFSDSCVLYIGIFNRFGNDFICYECIF